MLTASHEERQVLVADIAGAYLNAEMEDFVVMKFSDEMVDYIHRILRGQFDHNSC